MLFVVCIDALLVVGELSQIASGYIMLFHDLHLGCNFFNIMAHSTITMSGCVYVTQYFSLSHRNVLVRYL